MLQWILIIVIVLYIFFIINMVLTVLFEKGSPSRTLAWVLFLLMVPFVGIFLYSLFGKNQRKEKIFRRKRQEDLFHSGRRSQNQLENFEEDSLFQQEYIQKNKRLIKLLMKNGNAPLSLGNQVQILNDGAITFASVFDAIKEARSFLHLEYYIFEEGLLTHKLLELLIQKVKEGVRVRIIYDGVGSWRLSASFINKFRAAGIEIFPFMPVRYGPIANKVNYRNHRKIIVIDNRIGFTGGVNFSDKYIDGTDSLGKWRDTHMKLSGPAVAYLNLIFMNDWQFVSGQKLEQSKSAKVSPEQGSVPMQIVVSGPDSIYPNIRQEYFTLINSARSYVYIITPYFIPGEAILFALKTAALSSVDVVLLLPRQTDSKILKWSIQSYLEEVLEAGVKVYVYKKGFLHSKVIIVDDQVSSLGTANVDERSFESNFEVNALVYDRETCLKLKKYFFEDLQQSEALELSQFKKRPRADKLKESMARLLSPLL